MLSFPRDMYVPIPGHDKDKINAVFAYGGPPLTIRTLEGLLGTRMDHAALVNPEGFINLMDGLGGMSVYNEYPCVLGGLAFQSARSRCEANMRLLPARERKQFAGGDLDPGSSRPEGETGTGCRQPSPICSTRSLADTLRHEH
jgi:polyisoprenyl-teichoic acid--peptidoglycan teichoic acid transferase